MEAALQQTYWHASIFFANGKSPTPLGSGHELTAPYQAFRTADGYNDLGGVNQANGERIADTLGHPQWKTDARYQSNRGRMDNLAQLVPDMENVLRTQTSAH